MKRRSPIPADFPVQPIKRTRAGIAAAAMPTTCGACRLTWDDAIATGYTPAPAGRCPFEAFHK